MRRARLLTVDVAFLFLLAATKLAIDALVLRSGFSHVSDDDYARTVIAQQFAVAPRLDPSGTSWLPLPFWVTGAAMCAIGRSLASSRAIAVVLGVLGTVAPYAAMRATRVPRAAALVATGMAIALPWSAWLGVAMVPDGWTGALIAAGAIASSQERARPWAAAALFAASLSRYEAWPACAVLALVCGLEIVSALRLDPAGRRRDPAGVRRDRTVVTYPAREAVDVRREIACAVVALAGPGLWMAWNAHAHGSAFHFVARVSSFRRSIGAADVPWLDKLLDYPRALVVETPEAALLGALGIAGLAASDELRARWRWPATAALAILAFLVAGDLGDGAPTHHPARALGPIWWILAGMGVDAIRVAAAAVGPNVRRTSAIATSLLALGWLASLPARWAAAPGLGESERRDAQIARGLELRARDASTAEITPCQFEHFALLAAWGEPERARVNARTREPLTSACPAVTAP